MYGTTDWVSHSAAPALTSTISRRSSGVASNTPPVRYVPMTLTSTSDRVSAGDGAMPATSAAAGVRQALIVRRDLVATLDRATGKRVTIISAPAGSGKTSLLRAWTDRPGQDRRIAFLTVRPDQHD